MDDSSEKFLSQVIIGFFLRKVFLLVMSSKFLGFLLNSPNTRGNVMEEK